MSVQQSWDSQVDTGYLVGLELENIRAFDHLKLDFGSRGDARLLSIIIGRNGTCKSTLLRSIALGLGNPRDAEALLAYPFGGRLVGGFGETGRITLRYRSALNLDAAVDCLSYVLRRGPTGDYVESAPDRSHAERFICAYGAGRGFSSSQSRQRGSNYRSMDSVAMLFDYQVGFVDTELMLRRVHDFFGEARYEAVMAGIKRVIGMGDEHSISFGKGGGVYVSGPGLGSDVGLDNLADGYRLTFSWMVDLYGWAMQAGTLSEDGGIRGIVLLDEIEQHLHPSMQSDLPEQLCELLPDLQVIASTHSPLTALGTASENVIALHRDGERIVLAAVPDLTGYSAEDALVEDTLFGTDPFPRHTRSKLDRYRKLMKTAPAGAVLVR
jgi:hypothetical protein